MLQIRLAPGTYILAVSGGVDSMVLLDLMVQQPDIQLVVAHFDHGIRPDAAEDRRLVAQTAAAYDLPFESAEGGLGAQASEATARLARYDFLERVRQRYGARAIVTAHHQDDVLETAILNILRGTGRRGLTALASTEHLVRPLLSVPKQELMAYAAARRLQWREDSTNMDERYLRNYIRRRLLSRFDVAARDKLGALITAARDANNTIDSELAVLLDLQVHDHTMNRQWFTALPPEVAKELLAAWLRAEGLSGYNRKLLERVVIAAANLRPGSMIDLKYGSSLAIGRHTLALIR